MSLRPYAQAAAAPRPEDRLRDVLRVGVMKRKRTVSFVQNVRGSKANCIKLNLKDRQEFYDIENDLYLEFLRQLDWIAQGLIDRTWFNVNAGLRARARNELEQIGYEPPEEYKAAWGVQQELYYLEFDVGDKTDHYETGRGGWCVRIVDRDYQKMCGELSTALKEYEKVHAGKENDELAFRREERDALYAKWGDPADWGTRTRTPQLMPNFAPVLSPAKWLLGVDTDLQQDELEDLRKTLPMYPEPIVDVTVVVFSP